MSMFPFVVNLGGEGEQPDILNQQPAWAAEPTWFTTKRESLLDLLRRGHTFLLCPNDALTLPDECVDTVFTTSVPVDVTTWRGPGVQSSEIRRILKPGGIWIRDGVPYYTKP